MKNYKAPLLSFSKEELIDYINVSPIMAEKFEAEIAGAVHLTEVNGADASLSCGRPVEIKTQCYSGKYELRGRGKYGNASREIYNRKIEKNEHTIFTGFDERNGDVYYRFSFDFMAISKDYLASVEDRERRGLGTINFDAYLHHYVHHDSFVINHVSDPLTLYLNRHKFGKKFYYFLLYYAITGKIDHEYCVGRTKTYAYYKAQKWDTELNIHYSIAQDLSKLEPSKVIEQLQDLI